MTNSAVTLSDVSFSYPGKSEVLTNFSLEVRRGEHVFIIGPSGSGKTTLLNLIAGIILPTKGKVEVLGNNLSLMKSSARDSFRGDSLGIIFQIFNLIPYLSAIENVLLPIYFSRKRRQKIKDIHKTEAIRLLTSLGIEDEKLYIGSCSKLSVGQQQRVAAARALLGKPEIIIADEPTSALDFDRRQEFLELLFKQCQSMNATLLFVSHDSTLQERFSRVISLEGL